MDNGIQFLSLGGGVDSSALLAMHICRDESAEILGITREELDAKLPNWEWVVFADPGSEWKATYENIEYAKTICEKVGLNFKIVTYEQRYFRHRETNERIKDWQYRRLSKDEQKEWSVSVERQTIYEWLTELKKDGTRGSLPMLPGSAHQCSDRFKGGVQRKWADKTFGKDTKKVWSLGIEANENKRHKRFTMNRGENKYPQHHFVYPLVALNLTREDCKVILKKLNWDFRGDGSEVEKSSCMWCPWLSGWEVERLIDDGGQGLQEALQIEKQFYLSTDKHQVWHEMGKPMVKSGVRAIDGCHAKPFQTGECNHTGCEKYAPGNTTGPGTLIQLRYVEVDGKLIQKKRGDGHPTGRRLSIAEHIERNNQTEHGELVGIDLDCDTRHALVHLQSQSGGE